MNCKQLAVVPSKKRLQDRGASKICEPHADEISVGAWGLAIVTAESSLGDTVGVLARALEIGFIMSL